MPRKRQLTAKKALKQVTEEIGWMRESLNALSISLRPLDFRLLNGRVIDCEVAMNAMRNRLEAIETKLQSVWLALPPLKELQARKEN